MTTDIIELSKQVAEVLEVPPFRDTYIVIDTTFTVHPMKVAVWLAQDHMRCAEIAADKMIGTKYYGIWAEASWWDVENFNVIKIKVADHNNDRLKAYCVAICKAVLEQGKE